MTRSSAGREIVLVDHGMGNLRSVARAVERTGACPRVTQDPVHVSRADRVIVPGVGSLRDCMQSLHETGLAEALRERIQSGRPYLGICLGLHVLAKSGDEGGEAGSTEGLGLVEGRIARFPDTMELPIPHMGWNEVVPERPHPLLERDYFYFVHAYRIEGVPPHQVLATTEYGDWFPSALAGDTWVAVQFHPEKSQRAGLNLLERFCGWSP